MGIISKLSLLALTAEARRHLDNPKDIATLRREVDSIDQGKSEAIGTVKSPLVKL